MPSTPQSQSSSTPSGDNPRLKTNTLLDRWGVTVDELTSLVDDNPSLRGMLIGYVAELKLQRLLESIPGVGSTRKLDDHDRSKKNDRVIVYHGVELSIESKSLQTNLIRKDGDIWRGRAQVDASDRRDVRLRSGRKLNTTLLLRGEFDILAVNCFAFGLGWKFVFARNNDLPTSSYKKYTKTQREQLIASLIPVSWPPEPPFVEDVRPLLDAELRERR